MKIDEVKTEMTEDELCACLGSEHNIVVAVDGDGDLVYNEGNNLYGWRLMPVEQILEVL